MNPGRVLLVGGLIAGLCGVCLGADDFPIVKTKGTEFVVGGQAKVFVGVNHYQCIMQEMGDKATGNTGRDSTEFLFQKAAENGMSVLRVIMYNLDDAKLENPAQGPKATAEAGGKLAAGEYVYKYTAGNMSNPQERLKLGETAASPATTAKVGEGQKVKLVMPAVKYAYKYSVYRRLASEAEGTEKLVKRVNARVGEDAEYVDDGSEQLKAETAPAKNATSDNPRTKWPTQYSKPFQTGLGGWNEDKFQALDRVLVLARKYGLRMILVLVDQHENNTGGVTDYCRAASGIRRSEFFTDAWVRARLKEWIQKIVSRVNSVSGIAYKDDGAIFAWELINEPYDTGTGANLRAWAREMASEIKKIDGNHLVCLGDDGSFWAEETEYYDEKISPKNVNASHSFHITQNVPEIDFLTWHAYPQNPGFVFMFGGYADERGGPLKVHGPLTPETLKGEFQRRANYAAVFEKPIFIGEWGFEWKGENLGGWMRSTLANMRKTRPEYKLGENVLNVVPRASQEFAYTGMAEVMREADYWVSADFLNKTDKETTLVVSVVSTPKVGEGVMLDLKGWEPIAQIPMPSGDFWNVANPLSAGFLKINVGNNDRLKLEIRREGKGEFKVKNVVLRKFEKAGAEDFAGGVFGGIAFWTWGPVGQGVLPNNEVFTGELKSYFERYEKTK